MSISMVEYCLGLALKVRRMKGRSTMPAALLLLLHLLLVLIVSASAFPVPTPNHEQSLKFIKASCSATRFPDVCFQSLASYAPIVQQSPRQLAQAALGVSLIRAKLATDFVTRLSIGHTALGQSLTFREKAAIKDCITTMSDSVYRIGQSIDEVKHLGRTQFMWHISNVQTWVSAALTDENTCMDGFADIGMKTSRVRAMVRREIVGVTQVTSNALALVNIVAQGLRV